MEDRGVREAGKVTKTSLDSYILFLEKERKALPLFRVCWPQSRQFFHYEFSEGRIRRNPADLVRAPKIAKKGSGDFNGRRGDPPVGSAVRQDSEGDS